MTNFLKNNQEKILLLLGFVLVFSAGFSSGYFFLQEQDSNEYEITIEEPSQDCKDLFNAEPIKEYVVADFNSSSQVKGEQNKSDNINLQNKTGAFVASKNSKVYHLPGCQYAKRIKDANKIWFKSAEEARSAGYSPHSCVK